MGREEWAGWGEGLETTRDRASVSGSRDEKEGNRTKGPDKHRAGSRRRRESEDRTQDTAGVGEDSETREPQAWSPRMQMGADAVENRMEGSQKTRTTTCDLASPF